MERKQEKGKRDETKQTARNKVSNYDDSAYDRTDDSVNDATEQSRRHSSDIALESGKAQKRKALNRKERSPEKMK